MAESTQQKKSYKDTLNLPKTAFAMKANLVQNEPASMKRWAEMKLYEKLRSAPHPRGRYVFHDGPPYANGSIHLGHLLNKVLKDLVVRSRGMMGFDVPYTPGWDCHGLPIEHKVVQDLGERSRTMAPLQIRQRCHDSAEKFIKLQKGQMQRLLTLADYDKPYLTMDPAYEAAVLEVFAELVGKGLVYRALKPVHWSIENRTALAEAELEYQDREDTSVYVKFEVKSSKREVSNNTSLMIWTTTPWTLPANLAVAVHPAYEYGEYDLDGQSVILATALAAKVLKNDSARPRRTFKGSDLVGTRYQHPFIDRVSPVVAADYVTLEDGTGLVHTAPGHGVEDYQTGLREKLDIYCPVREDGTFDDTAPDWLRLPGVDVWKANDLVVEKLRESGHLFHAHKFTHSYPHDWRGKTPTIFRATEQWFISVDKQVEGPSMRAAALAATEKDVAFIPDWGRNRMRGMLESRPDWCVSRQRTWGLPIPAFFPPTPGSGEPLLTAESVRAVMKVIATHGSDAWFKLSPAELLAGYDPDTDPRAPAWIKSEIRNPQSEIRKSTDIFDVWFDSGCSWHAALERMQHDFPADLYLEGSDQHRGWFQVSLLPALAVKGVPPFRAILTHGFMVDKDGKKMSKSLGNTLEVESLLKEFGADVCRWWVASLNYENDIKVDLEFFKHAGEEYRKVRNTLRYLLSNLYDFNPAPGSGHGHSFTDADACTLDAWALGELNQLIEAVSKAYESFHFRGVHEAIFDFCNQTMSAVYLAATKDRLYCDPPGSERRRRTQTTYHAIADALIRLMAPVLSHTADEAWAALNVSGAAAEAPHGHAGLPGLPGVPSVHLAHFPEPARVTVNSAWATVMAERDRWLKAIEQARQERSIENPLELGLRIGSAAKLPDGFQLVDLADLCGISRVEVGPGEGVEVLDLRNESRCERSWKRDGTVKLRPDGTSGGGGAMLSDRDAAALGLTS